MKGFSIRFIILLLTVGLAACGDGPPTITTPLTPKEQVRELERQGALPRLDRSAEVAGTDADGNGVRDDVDAYIGALPVSPAQKQGAEQLARSLQTALLLDTADETALREASTAMSRAVQCVSFRFSEAEDRTAIATRLEAITANTEARAQQYIAFNDALSGTVFKLLTGDTCGD